MKRALVFFICLMSIGVNAQTKEETISRYFSDLPVFESMDSLAKEINARPDLVIDSITKFGAIHFHSQAFFKFPDSLVVFFTLRQTKWVDKESGLPYDTATVITAGCLFPGTKEGKKHMDAFYRAVVPDFKPHYSYFAREKRKSFEFTGFKLKGFDNFSELVIFKGQRKETGEYYVNLVLDRRTQYMVKPPTITIRSF